MNVTPPKVRVPGRGRWSGATWRAGAVLAALAVVSGCTGSSGPTGTTTVPATTSAPTGTASPTTEATAEPVWATVYFLVDTRVGLRLARERQDLGADGVQDAVEAMIAGPVDPDYTTPWNPDTEVLAVTEEEGLVTVDLSGAARTASIGSEGAALMIQQLVWTVTEAAGDPTAGVQLMIEGQPAGDLWGVVTWEYPAVRAEAMDVRMLVQLDVPAEDESFPSAPVTISGEAAAFEANVPWRITDTGGAEVASGFTLTAEGQTFAPFSFEVDLPPGEYVVEISEDDPSGGEAGTPMSDTRTFSIEG